MNRVVTLCAAGLFASCWEIASEGKMSQQVLGAFYRSDALQYVPLKVYGKDSDVHTHKSCRSYDTPPAVVLFPFSK